MEKDYYTPGDVDQLLPEIKKLLEEVSVNKRKMQVKQAELQSTSSMLEYVKVKRGLDTVLADYWRSVENVESLGCVLKSDEDGLLDFPGLRNGEEVWLCWRMGEDRVRFWHGLHEGFMGRKPIVPGDFKEEDTSRPPYGLV